MSFYNLPLLFMLGGRNDVFLWLTGWSYGKSTSHVFESSLPRVVHRAVVGIKKLTRPQ